MKGFYSVLIGVLVLMVLATAVFTVSSFNKSQALIPQKESFSYTVKQWQNARRMLDKATADAIIDAGYAANCLQSLTIPTAAKPYNPDTNIFDYDNTVLSMMNSNCRIKNYRVNKVGPTLKSFVYTGGDGDHEWNSADINVWMDLECRNEVIIGNDLNTFVYYDKNVLFEKRIDANFMLKLVPISFDCNMFVTDYQSNLTDTVYLYNFTN
ncbi:hypothetical protein KKB11_06095 [Candidatus Micrarchaeota archaeon]|nr:hypothetical protein [Candidatus Micrarchaeota archaeon]